MRLKIINRAVGAILDQNGCIFFAKNSCLGCEPEKKKNFGEKINFGAQRDHFFVALGALPKIWIICQKYGLHAIKVSSSSNLVIRTLEGVCQKIGIDHFIWQSPCV